MPFDICTGPCHAMRRDLRSKLLHRAQAVGAVAVMAAALGGTGAAQAAAVAEAAGVVDTQASTASASAGGVSAQADRSSAQWQVQVSGSVPGFFTGPRVGASAGIDADYTVHGLPLDGAMVTFTWQASGVLGWSSENASVGEQVMVRNFNKSGGPIYIHEAGWSIGFVDGPVFMGDFAGLSSNPFGRWGHAGPEGVYAETLPAGEWGGNGSVLLQTHWLLGDGWTGTMSMQAALGLIGDAQAWLQLRLVSATVAHASVLSGGPAWLALDNGTQVPISAVPEPASSLLWGAGGLLLLAISRWRRLPR